MKITDEDRKAVIDIWKTIVGVQQHFNDIEMRIRSMFVTILTALFAAIGFLIDKNIYLDFGRFEILFYSIVPLFGIFAASLFYFIDRYWYHRLLTGTVVHAISIEKAYKDTIPELSLSAAIGSASPLKPGLFLSVLARLLVRDEKFRESGLLHSDGKMELFYKSVMLFMGALTLVLLFTGGVQFHDRGDSSSRAQEAPRVPGEPSSVPRQSISPSSKTQP